MNILLLNTYAHGGAGIAARRLQSALRHAGQQADLLTAEQAGSRWPFYAEKLLFLPYERDRSVRFQFSTARVGASLVQHPLVQAADVLHLHWVNQGFLSLSGIQALAALQKPIVWTLHDMWAFTGGCHYSGGCDHFMRDCGHCPMLRRPAEGDLSRRIVQRKKMTYSADIQYVTCSQWLANTARQSSLLRQSAVTSIPNPIDTSLFKPLSAEERRARRAALDLPVDRPIVLFSAMKVGDHRKGYDYFVQALAHLHQSQITYEKPPYLLVLGDMQPEAMRDWPLEGRATGLVSEPQRMADFYALADAFVIPSLEDNLPNTVMESLACGTPVVGFDTGGVPEMVGHGSEGFIVPQRDAVGLATRLAQLLSDEPMRAQMRQSARQKVLSQYSEAVVAQRYVALYERMLGKR
jgi:glycosyltransferase involved in cell wall biosynthesis